MGNKIRSKSFIIFLFYCTLCIPFNVNYAELSTSERLEILEAEIESLKFKKDFDVYKQVSDFGPAASKVYNTDTKFSVGGYGELKYRNYNSNKKDDGFDLHRFIIYLGYKFSDKILLNTEIEIEHADEIFVEFAYLDFLISPIFSVRVGLQLVPIGIVNYLHEPTTFYSTNRPQTERHIIPSTWREQALLLTGSTKNKIFLYNIGIFGSGDAREFSDSSWIRGGRQQSSQALANDLGAIINLQIKPKTNLQLVASYYVADNGQGKILPYDKNATRVTLSSEELDALENSENPLEAPIRTHLAEVHLIYQYRGFSLRGLFARGWMNEKDTRGVNRATGKNIGQEVEGKYIELAYDLFQLVPRLRDKQKLVLFIRAEHLNTQKKTARCNANCASDDFLLYNPQNTEERYTGNRAIGIIGEDGSGNPANDRQIITYGLAYAPHNNVIIKFDYENWSTKDSNEVDNSRWNLSMGWIF